MECISTKTPLQCFDKKKREYEWIIYWGRKKNEKNKKIKFYGYRKPWNICNNLIIDTSIMRSILDFQNSCLTFCKKRNGREKKCHIKCVWNEIRYLCISSSSSVCPLCVTFTTVTLLLQSGIWLYNWNCSYQTIPRISVISICNCVYPLHLHKCFILWHLVCSTTNIVKWLYFSCDHVLLFLFLPFYWLIISNVNIIVSCKDILVRYWKAEFSK